MSATRLDPEIALRDTPCGRVLCEVFRGAHHVNWRLVKPQPGGQISYTSPVPLATFDGDELTRIVVAAHAHAVRVEVLPGGPHRIKLWLSPRTREGAIYQRHPTLAVHLESLGTSAGRDVAAAGTPEGRETP